jgi:hypothetical protein
MFTLRPGVHAGWASTDAPLDELPGIGGPGTLVGLRHDEWLGRAAAGGELRLVKHLVSGFDLDAYVQTGWVGDPVSRTDLEDRLHVAGGLGLRAVVPFGPLSIDLGIGESGARRFELSLGQEF